MLFGTPRHRPAPSERNGDAYNDPIAPVPARFRTLTPSSRLPPLLLLGTLLLLLPACGPGERGADGDGSGRGDERGKREARPFPVATETPARADVDDEVETQATLESDRRTDVFAEIDGRVVRRLHDVGDEVGAPVPALEESGGNGNLSDLAVPRERQPLDLAYIDGRDRALDLREAEIQLEGAKGKARELAVEKARAEREVERAGIELAEAKEAFDRTTEGIEDGTISREEHVKATFARDRAAARLAVARAALEKAALSLELVGIEKRKAELARDRALLANEKTVIRAPFAGVVTLCNVREGQRVRMGDLLYRVEKPSTLVVYGDLPVRQAARVSAGNPAVIGANAVPDATTGEVVLVAPTVDSASGTVRIKVRVVPAPGFKPGLFVTLRIVVDTRTDALTVPKRAVLSDDEDGAYVFVAEEGHARRVLVRTGYARGGRIEVVTGLTPDARVVVEGQDTLTDGAAIEDLAGASSGAPGGE